MGGLFASPTCWRRFLQSMTGSNDGTERPGMTTVDSRAEEAHYPLCICYTAMRREKGVWGRWRQDWVQTG